MGPALLGVVVQERGGVLAKGGVVVGWEERALEPDPAGLVSALVVAEDFLIRQEYPVII